MEEKKQGAHGALLQAGGLGGRRRQPLLEKLGEKQRPQGRTGSVRAHRCRDLQRSYTYFR